LDFRGNRIGGLADQRVRVDTYPKLAVDTSSGRSKGRLYMAWEDLSQGAYFNLGRIGGFSFLGPGCSPATLSIFNCLGRGSNVWLSFSDDGGATWSTPQRVDTTTPGPRDAFNIAIAVDPADGSVNVVWYDSRFDPLNDHVAVMWRRGTPTSTGVRWLRQSNILTGIKTIDLSEDIYRWTVGNFAGDYIQVAAFGKRVYISWTDTRNLKGGFHQEDNMLASFVTR
jgi:hypothetical protein